ncbi:MAG TPA: GNAT family N-acetyltransferase [Dongiaceae bacterium]|jgi:GNAT superfamily N-acetyltransferase|nr:GNAT family N-acetyltransferase [Dongiaceae bacterium]
MTGLQIREAELSDAEAIARVRVDGWNRAYGEFIPERLPLSWTWEEQTADWCRELAARNDGKIHLVALEASEILAFASGGPPLRDNVIVQGDTDAYTAQIYSIYVTPGRYGGGIGTRLLGALAARLAAAGHRNLCLWALELNPFRRFYDKLGGRIVARGEWEVEGVIVYEQAYAWPDIGVLIEACSTKGKTE